MMMNCHKLLTNYEGIFSIFSPSRISSFQFSDVNYNLTIIKKNYEMGYQFLKHLIFSDNS